MNNKAVIIIGAGGHAKVLLDILLGQNIPVLGFLERDTKSCEANHLLYDIPILGTDDDINRYNRTAIDLVNGIGSIGISTVRRKVYERFKKQGYQFRQVIHPSAVISSRTSLEEGVQVMAGAVINIDCQIKEDAIINTRASIDHDCIIGKHAHIAPGSVLSGAVSVGEATLVGVGSCVRQGITIGNQVLIGSGSNVISDIADNIMGYGNPMRQKRYPI